MMYDDIWKFDGSLYFCECIIRDALGWNLAQAPPITGIKLLDCISLIYIYKGIYADFLGMQS